MTIKEKETEALLRLRELNEYLEAFMEKKEKEKISEKVEVKK